MPAARSPARGTLETRSPRRPAFSIDGGGTRLPRSPVVLLLVDFINPLAFTGADRLAAQALAAARATRRLKDRLAREGVPTIYANDNYGVWRSDFHQLLDYCTARPGATGSMAKGLAPAPDDLVLLKPRHSAFFATPLDLVLSQMHARTLVLAGGRHLRADHRDRRHATRLQAVGAVRLHRRRKRHGQEGRTRLHGTRAQGRGAAIVIAQIARHLSAGGTPLAGCVLPVTTLFQKACPNDHPWAQCRFP